MQRIMLSETYTVEDCNYYNSGTITSSQTLTVPNMQSNFKATWKLKKTASTTSSWLEVGADSSNLIFGGHVGSAIIGVYKKVSGTQSNLHYTDGAVTSMNTEYPIEFTYEDGTLTVKCNGKITTANYTYTDRGYANLHIENNQMKELKIKPL